MLHTFRRAVRCAGFFLFFFEKKLVKHLTGKPIWFIFVLSIKKKTNDMTTKEIKNGKSFWVNGKRIATITRDRGGYMVELMKRIGPFHFCYTMEDAVQIVENFADQIENA